MRQVSITFLCVLYCLPATKAATAVTFNAPPRDFPVSNGPDVVATGDFNGDRKPDLVVSADFGTMELLLGNGDGTFQPARPLKSVSGTGYVAVGDFNGDGKLDIVEDIHNYFFLLLGNGDGTFQKPLPTSTGSYNDFIAASDVNGDGKLDLITCGAKGAVEVFLGNGDGTFQHPLFSASAEFSSLAVGDLNGDGKPDLVEANAKFISLLLGNGDGTFQPAIYYGGYSNSIALGDFNGDGKLDVVSGGGNALAFFPGNGNGTLGTANYLTVGYFPFHVATGDMNGDGKLDIVATTNPRGANGASTVAVLLGKGDGTFDSPIETASDYGPGYVLTTDLNGDGKLDAVYVATGTSAYEGAVSVLLGVGNGTFLGSPSFPAAAGSSPRAIGTGDFNGDARLDLVTANQGSDQISLFLGNGESSFEPPLNFSEAPQSGIYDLAVGDFNNDGRPDVVTTNAATNTVGVLLGTGPASFGAANYFSTGKTPEALAVGDFNGDGNLDLITANVNASSISVLPGKGDGTFQTSVNTITGLNPIAIAVGDFNGDGKLDVVVGSSYYLTVYLGNGDGTFLEGQSFNYVVQAIAVGDLNGDGKLDLAVAGGDFDQFYVLLGNGNGTFTKTEHNIQLGSLLPRLVLTDLNGDGKLDAIAVGSAGNSASVLIGNGDGTFTLTGVYGAGFTPYDAATGDFNGDAKQDFAIANSEGVVVFTNTTP